MRSGWGGSGGCRPPFAGHQFFNHGAPRRQVVGDSCNQHRRFRCACSAGVRCTSQATVEVAARHRLVRRLYDILNVRCRRSWAGREPAVLVGGKVRDCQQHRKHRRRRRGGTRVPTTWRPPSSAAAPVTLSLARAAESSQSQTPSEMTGPGTTAARMHHECAQPPVLVLNVIMYTGLQYLWLFFSRLASSGRTMPLGSYLLGGHYWASSYI